MWTLRVLYHSHFQAAGTRHGSVPQTSWLPLGLHFSSSGGKGAGGAERANWLLKAKKRAEAARSGSLSSSSLSRK